MKVILRKITKTPLDFEIKSNEITFKGYLQYHFGKLILLNANISGLVDTQCNQCGDELKLSVDEEVKFFISDGIYHDKNDIELDVIESFDSNADLDEILNSEIELIKSDYYSCKKCKNS